MQLYTYTITTTGRRKLVHRQTFLLVVFCTLFQNCTIHWLRRRLSPARFLPQPLSLVVEKENPCLCCSSFVRQHSHPTNLPHCEAALHFIQLSLLFCHSSCFNDMGACFLNLCVIHACTEFQ